MKSIDAAVVVVGLISLSTMRRVRSEGEDLSLNHPSSFSTCPPKTIALIPPSDPSGPQKTTLSRFFPPLTFPFHLSAGICFFR